MGEGGWDVDKELPLFLSISYFMLLQEANFPPTGIIKLSSNPFYFDGWDLRHQDN